MAVVIKVGETEAVSVDIGEKVYIQGDPGFSPTIEVTDITGGHRLTITDITGDKTVDVMNGAKGDTGATGNGIDYITLNANYTLTVHYTNGAEWTSAAIRGEKGDKGDTGDTGPTGPQGQPGQTGATPDISIGTVETLPPGSPATATMTGTAENPVLSFGIPQGQQGAPGEVTQAEFDELADDVAANTQGLADQKSAIENVEASLATVETTSTASRAYAVGELLVYGNRLYRVASVIAAGATLTPNTNITPTTVEGELGELETGIADLQDFAAMSPEAFVTKGAYVQNGVSESLNARVLTIKNGLFHLETGSTVTNYRGFYITNTIANTSGIISGKIPIVANVADVTALHGCNCLKHVSRGALGRAVYIFLFFCTVENDTVTVLARNSILLSDTLSEYVYTVPDGTTHYAIGVYTSLAVDIANSEQDFAVEFCHKDV